MTPLNYTPQAITDLLDYAGRLKERRTAEAFMQLTEWLHESVKVIAPTNGNLFDPLMDREPFLDALRMPYPLMAIEYAMDTPTTPIEGFDIEACPRRIALCVEDQAGPMALFEAFIRYAHKDGRTVVRDVQFDDDDLRMFVFSICYSEQYRHWYPVHSFAAVSVYGPEERARHQEYTQSRFSTNPHLQAVARDRNMDLNAKTNTLMGVRGLPFQPEFCLERIDQLGWDKYTAEVTLDLHDEMATAMDVVMGMNCINAESTTIPAPEKLNRKRVKNGRRPLYEYKVLSTGVPHDVHTGARGDGHHASPRTHLRRGHLRRLKSGKVTWVKAALINADAKGAVLKDYAVHA